MFLIKIEILDILPLFANFGAPQFSLFFKMFHWALIWNIGSFQSIDGRANYNDIGKMTCFKNFCYLERFPNTFFNRTLKRRKCFFSKLKCSAFAFIFQQIGRTACLVLHKCSKIHSHSNLLLVCLAIICTSNTKLDNVSKLMFNLLFTLSSFNITFGRFTHISSLPQSLLKTQFAYSNSLQ